MKRFISVLALCSALLVGLSLFLFPPVRAKDDPIAVLLTLPAPPPPNPLVERERGERDPKFYDKKNPPNDNAPIGDLLSYWSQISTAYNDLRYSPEPSDKSLQRIKAEIEKNPIQLSSLLNLFRKDPTGPEWVKNLYESQGTTGRLDKDERKAVRQWLLYNSPYYSSELASRADDAGDTTDYVSNADELLALTRVDFAKARPIIDRLYNDPTAKTSRVLARWALYRHALDTDSLGDIEQYRDELKAIVEDKNAIPGMRDLAMDALVGEKEWSGRDDWYFSLLGDETLAELKVNGTTYTGLTTLMLVSPDDKYVDKLLDLLKTGNPTVRAAVIRNLLTRIDGGGPEVIKALLPWLEDPHWAKNVGDSRAAIVQKLTEYEIPESVPGLIKMLDEVSRRAAPSTGSNRAANMAANAMANANAAVADAARRADDAAWAAANAMRAAANSARAPQKGTVDTDTYEVPNNVVRYQIVQALTTQKDPRAVPILKRILPESSADYDKTYIVKAILVCGGFTVAEQMAALELAARGISAEDGGPAISGLGYNTNVNAYAGGRVFQINGPEVQQMLASQLLQLDEISDDLARGLVDRIEGLDKTDPHTSAAYRRMVLRWQNAVINLLLLRDLKRGVADSDTILRLLSQRKDLREKQGPDVFDIRHGTQTAVGIAACLIEDAGDYDSILDNGDSQTKIAMLSCARLIRAKLPVEKVAANLNTTTPALAVAAERYLESEDSTEARRIVLSRHPGEAMILGATSAFDVEGVESGYSEYLAAVYMSIENDSLYNGWGGSGNDPDLRTVEKEVRAEVKKDDTLLGIYAYDTNFVRIYNDRVIFSWNEDESRFRERPLSKGEFDEIKEYLVATRADELPPFLSCGGGYCVAKELVMVGRNGGRRVYSNTDDVDFFTGLDKIFADFKRTPATLRYTLSRDIPGLEIILASDDLHVSTVWKNGDDLRVCASQTAVRKKVKDEISKIGEAPEDEELDEAAVSAAAEKKTKETDRRQWEGYAWYRIAGVTAIAGEQPPEVEFIPMSDGLSVQREQDAWKARAAGIEIRPSENGLYKVVRGRVIQIAKGDYKWPVITPNGRWVFAVRSDTDQLVRVDLLTNREHNVDIEGYGDKFAQAFVPTLDKMLVVRNESYDEGPYADETDADESDATNTDYDPGDMMFVEPATGMVIPASSGELRPLSQQTFRPLQRAALANEFWAAMPDFEKNETRLGIYNAKWFSFRPVRTIPKIKFNSMDMWVDEAGNKVYFVYRGHLLALPLK